MVDSFLTNWAFLDGAHDGTNAFLGTWTSVGMAPRICGGTSKIHKLGMAAEILRQGGNP